MLTVNVAVAAGPDVVVGFIEGGQEFARLGTGELAVTTGTNSCNAGDQTLSWRELPDPAHPVIAVNLYRAKDGRFSQLGASWVKHGYFATNRNDCVDIEGVPTCQPGMGDELGPGCSDLYAAALNANPERLGPRGRINPSSGVFDGATAQQSLPGSPTISNAEKVIVVSPEELSVPGARYFIEAQYVSADDAQAGNARNNVTFKEFAPYDGSPIFIIRYVAPEQRGQPAISAWEGAKLSEIAVEESGHNATMFVASKASPLPDGTYRYDYVLYNMNSDRGVRSLLLNDVSKADNPEFSAPSTRGEPWSNVEWTPKQEADAFVWSTEDHNANPNANALRWGNAYSFSFVAATAPVDGTATLEFFKPGVQGEPSQTKASVVVPGPAKS